MVSGLCIFESWFHCCLTDVELLSFGFRFQTSRPSVRACLCATSWGVNYEVSQLSLCELLWNIQSVMMLSLLQSHKKAVWHSFLFLYRKRIIWASTASSDALRGTAEMSMKSNLVEGGTRAAHSPVHCYLFSSRSYQLSPRGALHCKVKRT